MPAQFQQVVTLTSATITIIDGNISAAYGALLYLPTPGTTPVSIIIHHRLENGERLLHDQSVAYVEGPAVIDSTSLGATFVVNANVCGVVRYLPAIIAQPTKLRPFIILGTVHEIHFGEEETSVILEIEKTFMQCWNVELRLCLETREKLEGCQPGALSRGAVVHCIADLASTAHHRRDSSRSASLLVFKPSYIHVIQVPEEPSPPLHTPQVGELPVTMSWIATPDYFASSAPPGGLHDIGQPSTPPRVTAAISTPYCTDATGIMTMLKGYSESQRDLIYKGRGNPDRSIDTRRSMLDGA